MAFAHRFSPPQLVQALALLAIVAGVATWSSLLLTPAESRTPQAPPQTLAARAQSPAQQWFSNQPQVLDIKVTGLLASPRGAVAILSLNDAPPRSFLVGERLAQGVRLVAIEGDAVVIERGGERSRLDVGKLPEGPALPVLTRQ
ncbi:type II secretion system protein N [Pseudomonas chlororaphis]|uniref:General secretion pathway protein GspC n=1 Tax=Pseudomonas chlororaphis TaxID=587753 RepID=A0A1Q8EQG0_9PSED|nr:type II secretion system protein N [Pseudomonas chlororaphis]OLF54034.1 general secretion pathway protein GspC [Pseudomonas chlororaphis]